VPEALAGERLDRVVAVVTGRSRSAVREMILTGAVTRNGEVELAPKVRVSTGDIVQIRSGPDDHVEAPATAPDPTVEFDVVYEDLHLVVVDKPVGLVVHPGAGRRQGTLVNGLLARYPEMAEVGDRQRPGIVHRLDRETSGLLVVARTAQAYKGLVAAMGARQVERRYDVLVVGEPTSPSGLVDAPIGRSRRARTRMAVTADGREARTRYELVATFSEPLVAALLSCRLETGRTHQIRVHLASIGLPVLGDRVYGRQGSGLAPRPMLHAAELAFTHPATGAALHLAVPRPADFEAVLAMLT